MKSIPRLLFLIVLSSPWHSPLIAGLIINEIMNGNAQADREAFRHDWIELYNDSEESLSLSGFSLTDDSKHPLKFVFPKETLLKPAGYLLIRASGSDQEVPDDHGLHTGFKLREGEEVVLFDPSGEKLAIASVPPPFLGYSWGRPNKLGTWGMMPHPSLGTSNASATIKRAETPRFSVNRSFRDEPFQLTLTNNNKATIRYTLDGSAPSPTHGNLYQKSIRISETTVVRALSFTPNGAPSAIATHTYVFPAQITKAPNEPPNGWPHARFVNSQKLVYGMNPAAEVNSSEAELQPALKALPSLCISTNLDNLLDKDRGIYVNAMRRGRAWERPVSLEFIDPSGDEPGFQIDAGLRIRGGASRRGRVAKHSFRIDFRSCYGERFLKYPLFGDEGVSRFRSIDLRTAQNYSWASRGSEDHTFLRDVFCRDTQRDLGQPYTRSRFYHLYLNGIYWGIYQTQEEVGAPFAAAYLGGQASDYDVIKVHRPVIQHTLIEAAEGDLTAWRHLWESANRLAAMEDPDEQLELYHNLQGRDPAGQWDAELPIYLDVENLIDYMAVILFTGNADGPVSDFLENERINNWAAVRRRNGDHGFQFFVHDSEHSLGLPDGPEINRLGPWKAGHQFSDSNPQWLHQQLMAVKAYRRAFSDRLQDLLGPGGALTHERCTQRLQIRVAELANAKPAHAARWGGTRRTPPLSKDDWLGAVDRLKAFLEVRPEIFRAQLQLSTRFALGDPWENLVMAPLLPLGERRELAAQPFAATPVIFTGGGEATRASAENIVLSELMYHPAPVSDREKRAGVRDADDFEFLELVNVSEGVVSMTGVRFIDGIKFQFEGRQVFLKPGEHLVIAKNPRAFRQRYGSRRARVLGPYAGSLKNGGERLTLLDAASQKIFRFRYRDKAPWPTSADGLGFSLTLVDPASRPNPDKAANWRASAKLHGSPGTAEPRPKVPAIVVNEILTNSDWPLTDAIELHNPSKEPAAIGGWFLTDDAKEPAKWRIPDNVIIPPKGYWVAYEDNDADAENNEDLPPEYFGAAFSLSSLGEEVYLFSADTAGNLTGYTNGIDFNALPTGVAYARQVNSAGKAVFALEQPTLGSANGMPLIGAVVISEVHYHPGEADPDETTEFVEIWNRTDSVVALYDPDHPENTWAMAGIKFQFPPGQTLAAGERALITRLEPNQFRKRFALSESVKVFGPHTAALSNGGERLTLLRPEAPIDDDGETEVPMVPVDSLRYNDKEPWPVEADGLGKSLERINPTSFTDEPKTWRASEAIGGTPGA